MAPVKAGIAVLTSLMLSVSALGAKDIIYPDASLAEHDAPKNPQKGLCYGKLVKGAVFETQILRTIVKEAEVFEDPETGISFEIRPPEYKDKATLVEVEPRSEGWFETPCPPKYTKGFVRTLQRSLAARGFLETVPTGVIDEPTRQAILKLQSKNGLPSPILATSTAKALGLIAVHNN